jgi:outer membrane protein TolC
MHRTWILGFLSALTAATFLGYATAAERDRSGSADRMEEPGERISEDEVVSGELPELTEKSTLADYLTYAALNNPGLRAAFYRWKASLERVPQMESLPDPRFNYAYFIREVETRVGPMRQKVGLSQTFPWFGTLDLRGSVAAEAANAEKARFEAARLRLSYQVANAYYEYYYLVRAVEVTRENVELVSSLEEVLETMFRAGETSNANLIKAQVELGTLEDRVRTLEDVRAPVVARLNAALNRPADAPVPEPKGIFPEEVVVSGEELLQQLAVSNPELRAIDSMAAKEKTSISLARKAYYPDITLGVDYIDVGPAVMPGVGDSGKNAVSAMVAVNLPIWHGKYRAAEKGARARYEAVQQERVDRENTLAADLEMALFEFRDAERKIELYRDTLIPRAEQSLEVSRQAFIAGEADFLDIIDAERILLEFRLSHERASTNRVQRLAQIEMLVGTGISESGPGEPTTGEEEENQ